jgi:hypothetical protein
MSTATVWFGPFSSINSLGQPNSGGTLATYKAGTSTPQATYQDANLTVLNTNPIALNALGQAFVFLTPGQAYKFVCFDSFGNQLWSEDNVTAGGSNIPSVDNAFTLGSSSFAWANVYVGANHAPVLDTVSGNIGYYVRTAAEIAASVMPIL